MIKAFLLLFEPVQSWDGVARAQRSFVSLFAAYLLPMVLISATAEGYGLVRWGKPHEDAGYQTVRRFTMGEAVVYELMQALLTIFVVLVAARILKALGETFHGRHSYTQAFKTIAYGLSPLFVFRLLDAFPQIGPWASWSLGILFSVVILYQDLRA